MKTITIEKTLYDFEEVREKALEKNRYMLVDDYSNWYDELLHDTKNKLEKTGFLNADIYFSGFHSQGDGACFDAYVDVEKLLDYLLEIKKLDEDEVKKLKNLNDKLEIFISKNPYAYHYNHEKTRFIDVEVDYNYLDDVFDTFEKGDEIINRLEKIVEELRLELCIAIYKDLECEYNYLTSDEGLSEWLGDDAYWFNEDGTIYESK